jgi:hypothetical protein
VDVLLTGIEKVAQLASEELFVSYEPPDSPTSFHSSSDMVASCFSSAMI